MEEERQVRQSEKKIALKTVSGGQQTGADHKNWQLIAYRLMIGVRSFAKMKSFECVNEKAQIRSIHNYYNK